MRRRVLTVLAVVSLTACTTTIIGGTRGSGTLTTETRDVSGFTEVVLQGSGTVNIEISDTESLTIEAEENLIGRLTSRVRNGKLELGTDGPISPTREIVYTLGVTSLDAVTIEGSGNIETTGVVADSFEALISGSGTMNLDSMDLQSFEGTVSGSGNIEVSGTTTDLTVSIPGSGNFSGEELESANAIVEIDGSGNAVVNVTDSLDATVDGSGNIEYLGDPASVSADVNGSGSIEPR